jgi:hypothetical protein
VSLSSESKLDEFEYGTLSDWIEVEAGTVCLTVTEDRAGINDAIFDAVYPVSTGKYYLVVITEAILLASVVDRSPILDTRSRIQVVHAAIDVSATNVIVTGEDITLASQLRYSQTPSMNACPWAASSTTPRVWCRSSARLSIQT